MPPRLNQDLGYGILDTNRCRATLPHPHQSLVRVNPADQREITRDSDQYLANRDAKCLNHRSNRRRQPANPGTCESLRTRAEVLAPDLASPSSILSYSSTTTRAVICCSKPAAGARDGVAVDGEGAVIVGQQWKAREGPAYLP